MKKPQILSALWLAATGFVACAQPTNPIQRLVLDSMAVVRIPVGRDSLTTIRLPSPPSDLESARVGTEPHPDALFLLAIQPGSPSFSVRALVAKTNTTLNVVWKGQTYVLDLYESPQPWLSVVFEAPREAAIRGLSGGARGVPPARLLGLLDTAKAYGLLRQQHPATVADIEVVRPGTLRDYGDYTIRTEEVFRFDAEDTLVFRIGISNKTDNLLEFVPASLSVRVGTGFYYQSVAEASGAVAPHSDLPVYFAVTGSSDGSRNALSPKNDFMILLQRIEAGTTLSANVPAAQPPVPTPELPQPAPTVTVARPSLNSEGQHVWASVSPPTPPKPWREPTAAIEWDSVSPPPTAPAQRVAFPSVSQTSPPVNPSPMVWQAPTSYPPRVSRPARSGWGFGIGIGGIGFGIQIGGD